MQKLVRVKLSVEEYVREQFHKQMQPPSQCPNCGRFHRLWGHAYYERGSTEACGKVIAFWVRRFRCAHCKVTVSCLPRFAQPYRLVNHTTLEAFVKGRHRRRDVQARWDLLQRYLRRFAEWQPQLLEIIGQSLRSERAHLQVSTLRYLLVCNQLTCHSQAHGN